MVWPVHLLDLSPTEHLWNMVERSIYMRDTTLSNIPNCEQLLRWHGLLVTCRINVKLLSCQASITLDTYPMIFGTSVYLCVCFYLEQLEICIIFLLKRQQWKEKLKKISFFITSLIFLMQNLTLYTIPLKTVLKSLCQSWYFFIITV